MMNKMIADKIYWVGKIDDRKVPFHRLTLEKGTTYNSYLLDTEKPTLIDTVDISFGGEYVKNLQQIIDLDKLKYVVINHVEPDHAGALPALVNKAKNITIVTTEKARILLNGMFKLHDRNYLIVKDGDTLDIGGKTLQFFETPYLHTEETMITYAVEDKILFPCDIFSTHIAAEEMFNDTAREDITEDFKVYYQLIMGPHRPYVRLMLQKLSKLEIKMIAPAHGYILRENVSKHIELYDEMSRSLGVSGTAKKALILFSSMTGNTAKVAQSIAQGLKEVNVEADVINVKNAEADSVLKLAEDADAIFIGSSTKYGDMIGNLEDILKRLIKTDLSGKLGIAFGSYGWSGEAIEIINDYIEQSSMIKVDSSYLIKTTGADSVKLPLRVRFLPENDESSNCVEIGRVIGEILNK